MKPVAFEYARPASVGEAVRMLATNAEAKVLAGGQTLGRCSICGWRSRRCWWTSRVSRSWPPSPRTQTRSPSARRLRTRQSRTAAWADPTGGFLARVARGIAYRAVRTRGTIGGSLAHADPAADWLTCLSALGAQVVVGGAAGTRELGLAGFVRGAMETELGWR